MSFVSDITHKVVSEAKEKNMILTKIEMLDPNKFILIVANIEEETVKISSPFFNKRNAERLEKIVLENDGDICEMCNGTGEIDCMESVYPNEPHMAMVGSRTCECQLEN